VGPIENGIIKEEGFDQVPKCPLEHQLDFIREKAKNEMQTRQHVRDLLNQGTSAAMIGAHQLHALHADLSLIFGHQPHATHDVIVHTPYNDVTEHQNAVLPAGHHVIHTSLPHYDVTGHQNAVLPTGHHGIDTSLPHYDVTSHQNSILPTGQHGIHTSLPNYEVTEHHDGTIQSPAVDDGSHQPIHNMPSHHGVNAPGHNLHPTHNAMFLHPNMQHFFPLDLNGFMIANNMLGPSTNFGYGRKMENLGADEDGRESI